MPYILAMNVLEAVIIGLIQGLTEFLPVSSSGHIILISRIMGVKADIGFSLILHLATLIALIIMMRKEIKSIIVTPKRWGKIIVATAMSAGVVLLLHGFIEHSFDGQYLAVCFCITAAMLLISGLIKPKKADISYVDAMIIGCVQGLAALPGISRSGSTVSTSVLLGNDRERSVSFGFILSIPIIVGSSIIDLLGGGMGELYFLPTLCGFVAAFVGGLVSVKLMLKLSRKMGNVFGVYLIALSLLLTLNDVWLHIF